jgi:hypothetical protein
MPNVSDDSRAGVNKTLEQIVGTACTSGINSNKFIEFYKMTKVQFFAAC